MKAMNVLSVMNYVKEMFMSVFTDVGNLKEPCKTKPKQDAKSFYVAVPRQQACTNSFSEKCNS